MATTKSNDMGKIIDYVLRGLVVILSVCVPVITWQVRMNNDQEHRLIRIEANRFTNEDGRQVEQQIARIWQEMPKEVPPRWFEERVDRLETRIETLTKQIDRLTGRLDDMCHIERNRYLEKKDANLVSNNG